MELKRSHFPTAVNVLRSTGYVWKTPLGPYDFARQTPFEERNSDRKTHITLNRNEYRRSQNYNRSGKRLSAVFLVLWEVLFSILLRSARFRILETPQVLPRFA